MRLCRRLTVRAGAHCQQITVFECVFCASSLLQFIAFADVAINVACNCWLPHANDELRTLAAHVVGSAAVGIVAVVGNNRVSRATDVSVCVWVDACEYIASLPHNAVSRLISMQLDFRDFRSTMRAGFVAS